MSFQDSSSLWIFGYGSLLWRAGFPSAAPIIGVVRGWERRLDQGSPDHRGTPERLGRVATLVPTADGECWGAAFEVSANDRISVLELLDHRERGGYERVDVTVQLRGQNRTIGAVTWIASPTNEYYLGSATITEMVRQIQDAHGPSGSNLEYVVRLAETLRAWNISDPNIFALESELRKS